MNLRKYMKFYFITLTWGALLTITVPAFAELKTVRVEGVDYSVNKTMEQNLSSLAGKRVTIMLSSGKEVSGKVKAVSKELLHLEKLDGAEFFDALIQMKDINAIETRFLIPAR